MTEKEAVEYLATKSGTIRIISTLTKLDTKIRELKRSTNRARAKKIESDPDDPILPTEDSHKEILKIYENLGVKDA